MKLKLLILSVTTFCYFFQFFKCSGVGKSKKDYDPDFYPGIYIYAEEPDRDPVEIKKWVNEQKKEKAYIKKMEKEDKSSVEAFRKIIALQKSQLGKVSVLAAKVDGQLNKVVGETPVRFMPWN